VAEAAIFTAALDKPTEAERAAFLQAAVARYPHNIWLYQDLGVAAWPSR
jgi:hypothetical protein